jgi:hypothetical protein
VTKVTNPVLVCYGDGFLDTLLGVIENNGVNTEEEKINEQHRQNHRRANTQS